MSHNKRKHVPIALPEKLRKELVSLGRIPEQAVKSKGNRKQKRKQLRLDTKASANSHNQSKGKPKLVAAQPESEPDEPELVKEPQRKKVKVAVAAPVVVPPAKQTPLERLLAKQEAKAGGVVDVTRKKTQVESTEDLEIAWLEAKLGVRGGNPADSKAEKGKWKEEYLDDGLDGESSPLLAQTDSKLNPICPPRLSSRVVCGNR